MINLSRVAFLNVSVALLFIYFPQSLQIDHNFPRSTLLWTIEMTSLNDQNSRGTTSRRRVVSMQSFENCGLFVF